MNITQEALEKTGLSNNQQNKFSLLLDKIRFLDPTYQHLIQDAYSFASYYHRGQTRHDGSPFIGHPIDSADILLTYFSDIIQKIDSPFPPYNKPQQNLAVAVSSTILHDTVEDTDAELDEVRESFGPSIGLLVYGMTKPKKEGTPERREQEYQKVFQYVVDLDPKEIAIRLSDVLQNSYTLFVHREDKMKRIAHHMQDNYLGIAYLVNPEAGKRLQENTTYFLKAA